MRTLLTVALCASLLSGCAFKSKQHSLFCAGACIHHEGEIEKGGEPKPAAPEATEEPDKG